MTIDPNDIVLSKDDIAPTDDELLDMTKRKRLASGWYASVTDNTKKRVSDSGTLIIEWEEFPLEDPDNRSTMSTPSQRDSLILPIKNPNFPDHKKPDTLTMCLGKLQNLLGEDRIPRFPSFDRATKEWSFKNEVISEEEVNDKKVEVSKMVHNMCVDLWTGELDLTELNGRFSYIYIGEPNEKGYINVKKRQGKLPDDATLVKPPFGVK